ncbi:matrix-remodeling-associated protein 5 [Kryptolebias marmoratus]|uniref:matrix-remodeling-associated protein 5 n=1 Tax=Kryptolebias marmoratus TaxID=37003 RepID=UPI000D5303C8|nr:matrix-remodeling-associated protein 5 [Kryptolebias marmoratus]XP_037833416.1 matrix-remodeling-associated protein 5 [Kryptolebias marmoratus]
MEHAPSLCILVLIFLPPVTSDFCPRPCSCPQPKVLHCTFRSLFTIPAAVPKHTERINLGFNSINQIGDRSLFGLRKLEQLMLHGNNIYNLPDGVFRDLASLQMLKISYNKLKEISRQTLHGLWSLIRLYLDHNHLKFIHPDTFQGLTSLRILQLEGNQLQQLHPSTFTTFAVLAHFHISTLRNLHLSDNRLESLPPRLVETMPQLENLYLHGNPWSCDCNMRWLQDWKKTSPGVLKCKNDMSLPGGRLCARCSSPRHLSGTELHAVEHLVCHIPVISSPNRTTQQKVMKSKMLDIKDFKEPLGNVSLDLSDAHGNKVNLECSVGESKGPFKINWEQVNQHQLITNITFSVDLECPVDRAKYEQLWRLIAYYSSVPAHLKRKVILSKTPHPTYTYKQDSMQDALYYTGVEIKMMAWPVWLMQPSVDLQLNRPQSSAKIMRLILSTNLSTTVENESEWRQKRTWVMIESTNRTSKVLSAIQGGSSEMYCNVHSSDQPIVQWMLPDGSKVDTLQRNVDHRIMSKNGSLTIKTINHKDMGIYYCISQVHGDFAVLPFYLTVQESSSPSPGEETSITPIEEYPGNPLSLDCTASGSPDAEIYWILPSNNIVSFHANSSKCLVYSNGTLHIPKIQILDSGYYKCVAINAHGADTLVKKITVARHKGLIQPLWMFPTGPQSASGVNTQIKVPTGIREEEASGDFEKTQDEAPKGHLDLIRRIPGGVAPGRRVIHPSRKMWRRPPVLRKPLEPNSEDAKIKVGTRRRVNITKGKIDPKKWADILQKIRGRNIQKSVTMNPVQYTTEIKAMEQTKSLKTPKESSNSIIEQERWSQDPSRTQGQGIYVTPESYTVQSLDDITSNRQNTNNLHTTIKPELTQSAQRELNHHTSSNDVFFLPETTSVLLHAITLRQVKRNSLISSKFSLQENCSINTDVDKDKTADWSKALERSVNRVNPRNDREHFFGESQTISSVNLQSASDLSEISTISQFHLQPMDTTINYLKSEAILTTASPSNSPVPNSMEKVGSERQPAPSIRQPNSQRRNGGRKRKANRRKHKLKTPAQLITTTPVNTPLSVVKTSVSTEEKTEQLKVTVGSIVPFTESQVASFGRPSHKESTVSRSYHETSIEPSSLPGSLFETKDTHLPITKPLFQSTSATPIFPTASLGVDHGSTTSHTTLDILENASPPEISENVTLITQPKVKNSPLQLDKPSEDTQKSSVAAEMEPTLYYDSSVGSFQTMTHLPTDIKNNPSANQRSLTQKGGKRLWEETRMGSSLLPPPLTSAASLIELGTRTTSEDTSSRLNKTPSMISEQDLVIEKVTALTSTVPTNLYQNEIIEFELKDNQSLKKAQTRGIKKQHHPPLPRLHVTTPKVMLHGTKSKISSTEANTTLSLRVTTQRPEILVNQSQDQQINLITATLPTISFRPIIPSPSQKLAVINPTSADVNLQGTQTSIKISTVLQSTPSTETLLAVTKDISTEHRLAKPESMPRRKPKTTKNNFQTITVKAGTDAQLPCEVEGQPKPFLCWTKVATALPPKIQQTQHENVTLPEGGTIYMNCTATGTPQPVIHWVTPDGIQLSTSQPVSGQNLIIFPNGTLHIRRLGLRNSGSYECSVRNTIASATRTVTLNVRKDQVSAKVTISSFSPQRTNVIYGSTLLLNCVATGHPKPRILWKTPSKKLVDAQYSFDPRIKVFLNGSITIYSVTEKDSGDYLCIARNKMGDDYVQLWVGVLTRPAKIDRKQQQLNQEVVYGEDLKVDCVASGIPNPEISWALPDGTMVNPVKQKEGTSAGRSRRYVVFDNGTLYLYHVGMPEEGEYTCYAENQLGKDEMKVRVRVKTAVFPPQIQDKDGNTIRVFPGQTVTLQCNAKGEPVPDITWMSPTNRLISPVLNKYQILNDGILIVQKAQHFDGGNYTCMARNSAGQDHKVTRLEVLVKPPVINYPGVAVRVIKTTAVQGQKKLVDCVAKGTPTSQIMWILPGNVLLHAPYNSSKMTVHQNGTLEIQSAKKTDSGQLVCVARNDGGEVRLVVNLDVKEVVERPQMRVRYNLSLRVGDTITLNCSFEGLKLPRLTWILPNGTPLNIGARYLRFFHQENGSLIISNPTVAEAGMYRCLGYNSAGLVERTIILSLERKPEIQNKYISPVSIMNGETLFLHCQTTGEVLRLTWTLPSGVVLNRLQGAGRNAVMSNGTLSIRQVSIYDRGLYVCRAANEYGSSLLSVSVTMIEHPPQITSSPPSVTYAKRGVAIQLNCVATGVPKVEVAWETPNKTRLAVSTQPRLFGNKYVHPQGSLIIQNPTQRDSGIYRCTAKNALGMDSKATFLNVF